MAIVRGVRKLLKSDFPDAPSWFDRLLSTLNQFMDSVIGALRNKLTFRENFYCKVKTLTFIHATEQQVGHDLDDFKGVLLLKTPNDTPSTTYGISEFHFREIDNTTIGITIEFAGAGTTSGECSFVILG